MKKYLINSFWLGIERVSTVLGGLLITIMVARYLGPSEMGMINLSIAIAAFIVPICQLGSDNLIFNRVAKKKNSGIKLLKATSTPSVSK